MTSYGGGRRADDYFQSLTTPIPLDGTVDCTVALKDFLEFGGDLYFPDGDYLIAPSGSDVVLVDLTLSTTVKCGPQARFFTHPTTNRLGKTMIEFICPSNIDENSVDFHWEGGIIDLRNVKQSSSVPFDSDYIYGGVIPNPYKASSGDISASGTTDGLSIRGAPKTGEAQGIRHCTVRNVTFLASDDTWVTAGGDSGLNIYAGSATIEGNYFKGCRDLGIYASSNNKLTPAEGGDFKIIGNTFADGMYGATVKRGAGRTVFSGNTFRNLIQGIGVEAVKPDFDEQEQDNPVSQPAQCVAITGNSFDGYILGVDAQFTDSITVTGNVLTNACLKLPTIVESTPDWPDYYFRSAVGIMLRGCNAGVVQGNVINGRTAEAPSEQTLTGILLNWIDPENGPNQTTNPVASENCLVMGNVIGGATVPIKFDLLPEGTDTPLSNSVWLNKVFASDDTTWQRSLGLNFEVDAVTGAATINSFDYEDWHALLDAGVASFTRSGVQWALKPSGEYQSFATDTLPVTDLGLRLEPESTNLVLSSGDYSTGSWSNIHVTLTGGQTDVFGGTAGTLVSETASDALLKNADNTLALSSTSKYTATFIVKQGSATWQLFSVTNDTLAARFRVWVNLSTGAVGSTVTAGSWTVHSVDVDSLASGYRKVTVVFTPGGSTDPDSYHLLTFTTNADNTTSRAGSGTYTLCHVQIEQGEIGSSPIVTTTTTATRHAGELTLDVGAGTYDVDYEGELANHVIDSREQVAPIVVPTDLGEALTAIRGVAK